MIERVSEVRTRYLLWRVSDLGHGEYVFCIYKFANIVGKLASPELMFDMFILPYK